VTGGYSVSAGYESEGRSSRQQVLLSLSRYAEAFGRHDLKFGLEVERGRTRSRYQLVDGLRYYDYAGAPYYAAGYSNDLTGHNEREGGYVQDAWKPTRRLTVSGGLRFDGIRGTHPEVGTVFETQSLSPRLGIAFDLGGDQRSVVKASGGDYDQGATASFYIRAVPGASDFVYYSVPDLAEIGRVPAPVYSVASQIAQPRSRQVSVAFERALTDDMRASVGLVRIGSDNFIDSVLPDARWSPRSVQDPLTGEPLTTYERAPGSPSAGLITNVDGFAFRDPDGNVLGTVDAYRRYQALMLVLTRRLHGRWQAQASYVLSRARGTVDNSPNTGDAYGRSTHFENASQALVNPDGALSNDHRHELKLLASYEVPRIALTVSGYFRSISGSHYTPVTANRVRLEPRGSRVTPTETVLDLRLEKVFRLRQGRDRLGVYADIANVFNVATVLVVQPIVPSTSVAGLLKPIPFGAPLFVEPPRKAVFGARWTF
jgi:hypothetical protein